MEPAQRELAEKRLELARDVEVGVQMAAHALDGHQGTDQEHKVRGNMKLVRPDERDQLAEQETEVDPVERQLGIGVNQLTDVAAQGLGIDLIAAHVKRIESAENSIGVLRDQSGQKIGDPLDGPAVE